MASPIARFVRPGIIVGCLAFTAALTGCEDPTAPLPREGAPDELYFSYGGFSLDMVTIESQGTTVTMSRRPWDWGPGVAIDTVRTVPTADAWRRFWIVAEDAGVQRWGSRYSADVIDGNGWVLRLAAGAFALESSGSNAYPDWRGRGHHEMTEEFEALKTALGDLVGEPL